jgi:hypothetical protein
VNRISKSAILLAIGVVLCAVSSAQEPACLETTAMGRMAKATSVAALNTRKVKAGDSYRAQVIYAARMLEIDPKNKNAAELLLNLIPREGDDSQQEVWLELDELNLCKSGGISDSDLMPLFRLQYHLPRLLARAVLLEPDHMLDYITYAEDALTPESDYALQMQKVCKREHKRFMDSLNKLPAKDVAWFRKEVINPESCKAIYFPEQ